VFKGGHAGLWQGLSSLKSTIQGLDELAEAESEEQRPEERERAHDIEKFVVLKGHIHCAAAVGIGFPEQQGGAEVMYKAAFTTKVDG